MMKIKTKRICRDEPYGWYRLTDRQIPYLKVLLGYSSTKILRELLEGLDETKAKRIDAILCQIENLSAEVVKILVQPDY